MADIRVNPINSYSSTIIVDGRKITIVDQERKDLETMDRILREETQRAEDAKQSKFGTILCHFGTILGFAAFLYMLSTAGHSDYCYEFNIADDWSVIGYAVRMVAGILGMVVGMFISKVGEKIKEGDYGRNDNNFN